LKKKVKGLVFDLDGTIIDSAKMVITSVNYALEPWGIVLDFNGVEKIRTRIGDTLFDQLLPERDAQIAAYRRLQEFTLENTHLVEVFDGVREILEDAKNKNLALALWTGRDTESAILILKINNLFDYFTTVVGNSCVTCNKPNTEGIIKISSRLNIPPEELVMIGDHEHDVIGGKDAGAYTIRALWAHESKEDEKISSDLKFSHVHQLRAWINTL